MTHLRVINGDVTLFAKAFAETYDIRKAHAAVFGGDGYAGYAYIQRGDVREAVHAELRVRDTLEVLLTREELLETLRAILRDPEVPPKDRIRAVEVGVRATTVVNVITNTGGADGLDGITPEQVKTIREKIMGFDEIDAAD